MRRSDRLARTVKGLLTRDEARRLAANWQVAGAAGTAPENANGLQRERRVSMTVSKKFSRLRCQLSRDVLFLLGSNQPWDARLITFLATTSTNGS